MVISEDVYVRSVRGGAGRWYRELMSHPNAFVHIDGGRVPVRAVRVDDQAMIARVSEEYLRKYARSPYMPPMLEPKTLSATVRLQPASA